MGRKYTPLPGGHAWLWPREAVAEWLDIEGKAMIQAHTDALTGQQSFDFGKPARKRLPKPANDATPKAANSNSRRRGKGAA